MVAALQEGVALEEPQDAGRHPRDAQAPGAGDTSKGLRRKPMSGYRGVWEASVDMGTRVTFEIDGGHLYMRANCNHDVLRRP